MIFAPTRERKTFTVEKTKESSNRIEIGVMRLYSRKPYE